MAKSASSGDTPPTLAALLSELEPLEAQRLIGMLTLAQSEAHGLLTDLLATSGPLGQTSTPDPLGAGAAFGALGQSLATRPDRLMAANMKLMQGWMALMTGTGSDTADKRFRDPEWTANPAFAFMRGAYELNTQWLMDLTDAAPDMPEDARAKVKFFSQQAADAYAPTNFLATNPAALRAFIETGGQSALDGLRKARADLKRGKGKLMISQTDDSPFELGKNIASSPGKVVFRNELIELIQYAPTKKKTYARPLLIFPPWINKFYVLDLREENSMIRWLVDKGLTVLVVSWRSACPETRDLTWSDYARLGVYDGVTAALNATGAKDLNAVGYCIGGTLLSGTMAHMAAKGDTRIKSATFFASQSDFELSGDLKVLTDEAARSHIDTLIDDDNGIMPGSVMYETFNWLRPVDLVWRYVIDQYLLGKEPKPFDLLYWNADQTNIPGDVHRSYLRDLYDDNQLARGEFEILGETVDLSRVTIPVMVQASRDDHICPYESVYRTAKQFSGPTEFIMAGSGHIAGVVNHPDAKKYQHWTNSALPATGDDWLADAEAHEGSWWPHWWTWLRPKSGKKIESVKPKGKRGLPKAPGDYVRVRLEDIDMGKT